ncbi:MAG: hypothetical protein H7A25_14315 [Leptospiraceae bacterium]|nr:hypothetical protein [Leptospiraceae bacterium]MCP5501078.1 hypothetical protein [Leptospiraceae bacterium]
MKTLVLQFEEEQDFELILSIARRLNSRIVETELQELDNENAEFSEEMKEELERRLSLYQLNPEDTYTLEDVKSELEERFGRKIQAQTT